MSKVLTLASIFAAFSKNEKFAEQALENGEVIVAEAFEPGQPVFMRVDGRDIPMEEGEYIMADKSVLVVDAEGKIVSLTPATGDAPPATTVSVEEFEKFKNEVMSGFQQIATLLKSQKDKAKDGDKSELTGKVKEKFESMAQELEDLKGKLHKRVPLDDKKTEPAKIETAHQFKNPTRSAIAEANAKTVWAKN